MIPGTEINAVIVVVNKLSKIAHFITFYFNKGKTFNQVIAKLLFNNIFKLYNLSREIVFNRDRRFILNVAR